MAYPEQKACEAFKAAQERLRSVMTGPAVNPERLDKARRNLEVAREEWAAIDEGRTPDLRGMK